MFGTWKLFDYHRRKFSQVTIEHLSIELNEWSKRRGWTRTSLIWLGSVANYVTPEFHGFPYEKSHAYSFYSIYLVSSSTHNCRKMSFTSNMAHVNFLFNVQATYFDPHSLITEQHFVTINLIMLRTIVDVDRAS